MRVPLVSPFGASAFFFLSAFAFASLFLLAHARVPPPSRTSALLVLIPFVSLHFPSPSYLAFVFTRYRCRCYFFWPQRARCVLYVFRFYSRHTVSFLIFIVPTAAHVPANASSHPRFAAASLLVLGWLALGRLAGSSPLMPSFSYSGSLSQSYARGATAHPWWELSRYCLRLGQVVDKLIRRSRSASKRRAGTERGERNMRTRVCRWIWWLTDARQMHGRRTSLRRSSSSSSHGRRRRRHPQRTCAGILGSSLHSEKYFGTPPGTVNAVSFPSSPATFTCYPGTDSEETQFDQILSSKPPEHTK